MGFTLVVKSIGQELAGLNSNLAFSLINGLGQTLPGSVFSSIKWIY